MERDFLSHVDKYVQTGRHKHQQPIKDAEALFLIYLRTLKHVFNSTYRLYATCFILLLSTALKAQTGEALNFDGTNDYVALPPTLTAALTDPNNTGITIEYWVKGNPQSAVRFQVGSDYIVSGWNGKHIISTEGGTTGISMGGLNDNNWNHVAMVWEKDKVNGFRSYLNGALIAQRTTNGGALPFMDASVAGAGNIGCYLDNNGMPLENMQGSIDEIRIWTVARQACEIQHYMNCNVDNNARGLLAYYNCNQGTANSLNPGVTSLSDATSNGYNGTLTNFALNRTISNWISPGGMPVNDPDCTRFGFPSIDISLTNGRNPTCLGQSVTFTATPNNNIPRQWKKNGVVVGSGRTYTDSGDTEGDIICEATIFSGCVITSNTIPLRFRDMFPNVNLVYTNNNNCAGVAQLTITGVANGDNLIWQKNGINIGSTIPINYTAPAITTVAGQSGVSGNQSNQLNRPIKAVFHEPSRGVYVVDRGNNRITFWGIGETNGITALNSNSSGFNLSNLSGICFDADNNMYVSDGGNHRILKQDASTGTVSVVAGGNGAGGANNQLSNPSGIFVDAAGNLYIADTDNRRIMKWVKNAITGTVAVQSIPGPILNTYLSSPTAVVIDKNGILYIADRDNHQVIKWVEGASSGVTVAGQAGLPGNALTHLNSPSDVYVDERGSIFIADQGNNRIVKWVEGATTGTLLVSTTNPTGLDRDSDGNLYIAEQLNHRIQRAALRPLFTPSTAGIYTAIVSNTEGCSATTDGIEIEPSVTPSVSIAQTGGISPICLGSSITFTATPTNGGTSPVYTWYKNGVVVGTNSATYVDAGQTAGSVYCQIQVSGINCLTTNTATSATLSFTIKPSLSPTLITTNGDCISSNTLKVKGAGAAAQIQWKQNGTIIQSYDVANSFTGMTVPFSSGMGWVSGVYVDNDGNVYASDDINERVVKWTANTGLTSVVAGGNGAGSAANQLYSPRGIWVDVNNNLYIADANNHRIVKWAQGASTGTVILGGSRGSGTFQLNFPNAVFVHSDGSVYLTDTRNNRIQRLAADGQVTTVVPSTEVRLPMGVFVDANNDIYFSETQGHGVYKWNVTTSTSTLIAGSGTFGSQSFSLNSPRGIWLDSGLNLYTADSDNNRIQKERFPYTSYPSITVGGSPDGSGGFTSTSLLSPYAVSVSVDGDLYVADYGNSRVQKFASNMQLTPNSAGTYSAIVTTTQGCTFETNAVTISTPLVTPSVSIAVTTGSQAVPQGTSVTFTATPTNGGTSPIYQWKKNGNNVGSNQATYTDAVLNKNDVISCTMTPVNICVTVSSVNSNTITMNVGRTFTWTGNFTTAWAHPANWHIYDLPSAIDDIIIPTTSRRPVLNSDQIVNSITFTGTSRVFLGNFSLSISNAITGANSDNYFVTNGNGGLIRRSVSNSISTLFPIGISETSYDPLSIQPTNRVDFTAKVKSANSASAFTGSINNFNQVVPRQWDISPTGSAGQTTLKITNGGIPFIPSTPRVGHFNTTTNVWDEISATYSNNVWTATTSQFSPFGVGDAGGFVVKPVIALKIFLEGAYDLSTHKMRDGLRVANYLPTTEPFTALNNINLAHKNGGGLETIAPSVLTATGDNAIVDWVLIELRDPTNAANVLYTRSALVQRDGDVVDLDGVSPVVFNNASIGSYFIGVKHRNHLRIRTQNTVSLSASNTVLNLTNNSIPLIGTNPLILMETVASVPVYAMYSGDLNANGSIDATDRSESWNSRNLTEYNINDCSLNGTVDATDRSNTWNNRNITTSFQ